MDRAEQILQALAAACAARSVGRGSATWSVTASTAEPSTPVALTTLVPTYSRPRASRPVAARKESSVVCTDGLVAPRDQMASHWGLLDEVRLYTLPSVVIRIASPLSLPL